MPEEHREMLEKVLPPRMIGPTPPPDAMTDDFTLEEVDPTREGAARAQAHGLDEEDEEGMGGERVQCASQ